ILEGRNYGVRDGFPQLSTDFDAIKNERAGGVTSKELFFRTPKRKLDIYLKKPLE
ncbi:hypothetical protein HAX54_053159, partial [Datura stramonium]|nr:hypothetical protein [Datura stramonium]